MSKQPFVERRSGIERRSERRSGIDRRSDVRSGIDRRSGIKRRSGCDRRSDFVVLMAEDDEHDILATKRAWKKHNIANPLYIVKHGEECLDFLHRRGKYSEPGTAPRPGILLLDIEMPKMDGLSVLKHIREDEELHLLPVIILTTSGSEEDRLRSYDLGVNAYIVKPVGFENFAEAVRTISLFWQLVELPGGDHGAG
jgi:CheY-like chemotaxis protein